MKHDDKLKEGSYVHVQVAMLYTTWTGQRLIRIINGAMIASASIAGVFRNADYEAVCNWALRRHG